jgi:hypothetical protein
VVEVTNSGIGLKSRKESMAMKRKWALSLMSSIEQGPEQGDHDAQGTQELPSTDDDDESTPPPQEG